MPRKPWWWSLSDSNRDHSRHERPALPLHQGTMDAGLAVPRMKHAGIEPATPENVYSGTLPLR